jgi:diadenosine tetraphosphate (Ap4A) HIT family hydrolase
VDGHCIIVPLQHAHSLRDTDEEVMQEIERFKSCLERMANEQVCCSCGRASECSYISTA